MTNIKPTLDKPITNQSKRFDKNFKNIMIQKGNNITEVDNVLNEKEQSLKKKIFSLPKMEALVFSDPKLMAKYDEMAENGAEKYGYHYNETIMNILFNDYVLNSSKYLQKYKQAIPKKKKRRDKSGINQMKKSGGIEVKDNEKNDKKTDIDENIEEKTEVVFLVNDNDPDNDDVFAYFPNINHDVRGEFKTSYSHIGQHSACHPDYADESRLATPEEYNDLKNELENQVGYNLEIITSNEPDVNETTTSGSVGGAGMGSGGYSTPYAWGGGNLTKDNKKSKGVVNKPIWKGGQFIQESNYLLESEGFENYYNEMNESESLETVIEKAKQLSRDEGVVQHVNKISDNVYKISDWYDDEITIKSFENGMELNENNRITEHHLNTRDDKIEFILSKTSYDEEKLRSFDDDKINKIYEIVEMKMGLNEKSESKSQQRFMGMVRGVQKGDIDNKDVSDRVNKVASDMKPNDVKDFASTKHDDLPEKVDENNDKYNVGEFYDNKGIYKGLVKGYHVFKKDDADKSGSKYHKEKTDNNTITEHHLNTREDKIEFIVKGMQILEPSDPIDGESEAYFRKLLNKLSDSTINDMYQNTENLLTDNGIDPLTIGGTSDEIQETDQSMIDNSQDTMAFKPEPLGNSTGGEMDMGMRTGGLNENNNTLLKKVDEELEIYNNFHNKMKKIMEDRKPSSLVNKERLGGENEKNFKSDMKHSGTKDIINVEKELQWKDQQKEVDKNPHKMSQDIEKESLKKTNGEALENVGNSTNKKGNEIPKRNLTDDEVDEVEKYRLGQQDIVYDNEPDEKFEDRMKKDMGDDLYKKRKDKLDYRAKAPMYNKDTQPVADSEVDKVQYNKYKAGYNNKTGFKMENENKEKPLILEGTFTGKYKNEWGKTKYVNFNVREVYKLDESKIDKSFIPLSLDALGNHYKNKLSESKNQLAENSEYDLFMKNYNLYVKDGNIFATDKKFHRGGAGLLNENENKELLKKEPINEQFNKIKHLMGYKPNDYVNSKKSKL